jgi:hypothetical protein
MKFKIPARRLAFLLAIFSLSAAAFAQGGGGRGGPPPVPKAAAPIDLTGYWVSIVTEDWRFRMLTPPQGDFAGVPLNPEGQRVGRAWDPAKDEAAGNQCKAYGAANIMRVPGRFHITWDNDTTLKIETDAGMQTRLLHFNAPPPPGTAASWQGYSNASWERSLNRSRGGEGQPGAAPPSGGSLKVVTTNLKAGYLRTNGAPYSDRTMITEYWDLLHEGDGSTWIVDKTIVEDPVYLTQPFITSTNLRRQPDNSHWSPAPCSAR